MLRDRRLLAVLGAEIVSGLGSYMSFLAIPWFVLVTTGSAAKMGVVLAAEIVPIALLGIPSGTLVHRIGARTTMWACDLARAPVVGAIPLLHTLDLLTFPLLVGLVGLIGVFSGPHFAAQRLILPELVGEDERVVAKANSVIEGAQRLNQLVGPILAGGCSGSSCRCSASSRSWPRRPSGIRSAMRPCWRSSRCGPRPRFGRR
jgi:MFS family permease